MGQEVITGSALLTPKVARMAIQMATPSIAKMMHSGLFKRKIMILGVIDGTSETEDGRMPILAKGLIMGNPDGGGICKLAVVPYTYLTAEDDEARRFEDIFVAKAGLTYRTEARSLVLREVIPQHLKIGDTVYQGSYESNGIIVAASGDRAYFDEAAAGVVGQIAQGLVRFKMDMVKDAGVDFITPELAARFDEALG